MMIANLPGEALRPTKPGGGGVAHRHKVAERAKYQRCIMAICHKGLLVPATNKAIVGCRYVTATYHCRFTRKIGPVGLFLATGETSVQIVMSDMSCVC